MKLLLDYCNDHLRIDATLPPFSLEVPPPKAATVYLFSTLHGVSHLFCSGSNFVLNNTHHSPKETQAAHCHESPKLSWVSLLVPSTVLSSRKPLSQYRPPLLARQAWKGNRGHFINRQSYAYSLQHQL